MSTPTPNSTPATTPTTPVTGPIPVQYDSGPSGELVVSEAAVEALGRTRPWVLLGAIVLFVVAGVGLLIGGAAGLGAIEERGRSDFGFLVVFSVGGLLFATTALIGGIYLLRFRAAASAAYRFRRPEDLERALLILHRLWRALVLALIVAISIPAMIVVSLILSDPNWP